MRIMCDWDLCVAPTDVGWWEWLCKIDGRKDPMPVKGKTTHYNLGEYFAWFKHQHGIDPQSYWDNLHLYDTMGAVEGAARVLNRWGRFGNNISVGSVTRGGHISSKFRHVKRVASDFSFEPGSGNGFFATKEKYLLPCDIAIDDRAENLLHFPDSVEKIYFNTVYDDSALMRLVNKPNVHITTIETPWQDIESILF